MAAKNKVMIDIRGKVPGKQDRSVGSPPILGSVSRIPRNYEMEEGGPRNLQNKASHHFQTIALALIGLIAFGIPMTLWVKDRLERDEEIKTSAPHIDDVVRVASVFKAPKEEEAVRLVKQALAVRSVADLKQSIRIGDASAREVIEFLGTLEDKEGKAQSFDWLAGMDANGMQIEGVSVKLGEKSTRLAMLTPDESGVWHLDFDSFARKVHPGWKQILSTPKVDATVRVYVGKDSYFNGPFADEKIWKCYALASPDTDTLMLGYVKSGSIQHIGLESMLAGKTVNRATLKIRHEETMEPRQFEIREVTAEDWVAGQSPYERRFTANTDILTQPAPAGSGAADAEKGKP